MNIADQMSPDASPGDTSAQGGVRRVNNMPVYIVGGLMTIFLLIMILVASDRAARQNRPGDAKDEKAGSTSMFAQALIGDQAGGLVQPKAASTPPAPAAPPDTPPIPRPVNPDVPPAQPPQVQGPRPEDPMERIRMLKLQQFEEAVKSRTGVQMAAARSPGSSPANVAGDDTLARLAAVRQQIDVSLRDDPTAAYQARLQQLQAAGPGGPSGGALAAGPGGGKDYAQFGNPGQEDRWKLDSRPEAPRSPYELRAGFVVPATLISGINSDLPGQIVAQVSQDVFDTATGKWKLIPQGARLVGRYSSDVAYGQSRVLIAWQRIVFPDGKAMDIGAMPGADSAGYAGFADQVNNHYLRVFGSAFLMSGVTAGIALSQPESVVGTTGRQSASSAMSEALGQQLGQVTAQLIAKNMNIAPTLEIRPGYRFNVIVTKDMTFSRPYQAFDY